MSAYYIGIDIGSTAAKTVVLSGDAVAEAFTLPTGWSGKETAGTIRRTLEEKGYLRCEKDGRVNRYTPLIFEEEYRRQAGGAVLEKLYDGSLKTFAAALWDGGRLSASQVSELRDYLDELEGGKKG